MPTALLSVFHKDGIGKFALDLHKRGWEILASGGTAKAVAEAGAPVRDVAELVGGGPILGHRVVTLSREIHASLLAQYGADLPELTKLGLHYIDLVCVDLYPLEEAIRKPDASPASIIESTDIGGPTMLRSAAKGGRIVICDPTDRQRVISWIDEGRPYHDNFIRALAAKAEATVANYCLTSGRHHSQGRYDGLVTELVQTCLYGENPQQQPASLAKILGWPDYPLDLHHFKFEEGMKPSYNNWIDLYRLRQTITHIAAGFDLNFGNVPAIAVGVKHGNACGAFVGNPYIQVLDKMAKGDPLAILGGIVMTNFEIDAISAQWLSSEDGALEQPRRFDTIATPAITPEAIDVLKRKKGKCRFLTNPALANLSRASLDTRPIIRVVGGNVLTQPNYTFVLNMHDDSVKRPPTWVDVDMQYYEDLVLAWAIGSTSNSNTITIVKDGQLIGNGVGQQDRVGAAELALWRARRAGHDTQGAVAYSDSFFPFPDGPEALAKAGIQAILASSGSQNDKKVLDRCCELGVKLYLIPDKVGRGFFGH